MLKSSGVYITVGIWSTMVMLRYAVAVPPVFVPLMVNMVREIISVGLPLTVPVDVSNERPLGSDGLMLQETISPCPVKVGANGRSVEAVSLVRLRSSGEYEITGTSSTMVMFMYAIAEPPLFVPVTVNMLRVSNSVGVPLIVPVAPSNERPAGSDGEMLQETIVPEPVTVGVTGRAVLAVLLTRSKSFAE